MKISFNKRRGKQLILSLLWFKQIIMILYGFYLSLIFVKRWSFNVNPSLFWCVAIPCGLLSFGYPILATLSSFGFLPEYIEGSPISFWLIKIFSSDVFGMITGLTLILSFFRANLNEELRNKVEAKEN